MNWKKPYRIYREEGLTVRKRGGRKGLVAGMGGDSLLESSDVGEAHAETHASPLPHDELVNL